MHVKTITEEKLYQSRLKPAVNLRCLSDKPESKWSLKVSAISTYSVCSEKTEVRGQ